MKILFTLLMLCFYASAFSQNEYEISTATVDGRGDETVFTYSKDQKWIPLMESDKTISAYLGASIVKKTVTADGDTLVRRWIKTLHNDATGIKSIGKKDVTILSLFEFNCNGGEMRVIDGFFYDNKGNYLGTTKGGVSQWQAIVPGSAGEYWINASCGLP